MMANPPVFLSAVLSYLIVISESTPTITPIATETSLGNQRNHRLTLELEEAKLKIARLESIFDETVQHINAKSLSLEECEKLIADMTHEMDRLQSDLSSLKVFPFVLYANIRVLALFNLKNSLKNSHIGFALPINKEGKPNVRILEVVLQIKEGKNPIPTILAETLIGLEDLGSDPTLGPCGSPLLLQRAAYHVGAYDMWYEYVLLYLQGESSRANERLNQLEEEVRLLWANMRKTNFELHHLESKAQDAENNMNLVASQVETMAAIVTEQWIQIRQLEQALHNAEVQALTVKRLPTRCKFLKFLRNLFGNHLQKLKGILDSSLFHKESPLHQLEKISSAAKKYHHELQGFIKQEMEKNEFTAALANKEVASALITFPIMSAWMLLCSQFS
ncbi:hypothetical protein C3L33_15549, partial [Rhododendron williamsianum]